ncbi:Detected protein of unknown function [Hibiscus syriacus]|uniref:Uncharacterized protein n=1 Tax=Hibiscus syriacus TaxID=106335 RepID=A0A6A2WRP6_HIBSY|nr:Detected protein of unknown function [Hibiscus syriacus]
MAPKITYVVILIILVAGSSFATRPGKTVIVDDRVSMPSTFPRKYEAGFQHGGKMFNFFPKGIPIPPSAPSKRHNSFVESTRN